MVFVVSGVYLTACGKVDAAIEEEAPIYIAPIEEEEEEEVVPMSIEDAWTWSGLLGRWTGSAEVADPAIKDGKKIVAMTVVFTRQAYTAIYDGKGHGGSADVDYIKDYNNGMEYWRLRFDGNLYIVFGDTLSQINGQGSFVRA